MDFRETEEIIMDYLVENEHLDIYKQLLNKFIQFLENVNDASRLFYIDR